MHSKQENTTEPSAWRIYSVLLFSTFVTIEAMTFQAPALPSIVRDFGQSMNSAALIILIFYIGSTTFSPIMGRMADNIGRKKVMVVGLIIFCLSEFAAAMSPSFAFLLLARLVQGIGVACILPVILAYISFLFPEQKRGLALGIFTAAMGLGATTGALAGGLLVDAFSWHIIYWLSGGLGVVGVALIVLFVPETAVQAKKRGYDLKGSGLLFLALCGLLSIPTAISKLGLTSPYTLVALIVGAIAVMLLWKIEQRVADPIIDISLLREANFILPAGLYLLSVMCLSGLTYSLAFFISERPGGSASQVGLINMCIYGCSMLSSPFAGHLADRYDTRKIVVSAMVVILLFMLAFSTIKLSTPLWIIASLVVVLGLANGMKTPALMKLLISAVPKAKMASGSGLFTMMKDVGSPLGATFGLGVFGSAVAILSQRSIVEQARQAGADEPLLMQLRVLTQHAGAQPTPQVISQLQQLGLDVTQLMTSARLDAMAHAIPWVTCSLAVVLIMMLFLSVRLQRRPHSEHFADVQLT